MAALKPSRLSHYASIFAAVVALVGAAIAASPVAAAPLVELHMHIAKGGQSAPRVALTLDLCGGGVDDRILDVLLDNRIPATLFMTGRWIARNASALGVILQHPDLFEIEDHGDAHIPAILGAKREYGLAPAGTFGRIEHEVSAGADDINRVTDHKPHWYRDATATYSPSAIPAIQRLGYQVAGFSVNGDYGASVSEARAKADLAAATDGDVIIAHMNQPRRAAGQGIAEGILALKARGFAFVRLDDVAEEP